VIAAPAALDRLSNAFARRCTLLLLALWLSLAPKFVQTGLDAEQSRSEVSALLPALAGVADADAILPTLTAAIPQQVTDLDGGGDTPPLPALASSASWFDRPGHRHGLPPATAPPPARTASANQARAPPSA
jgi:hypothetical protein